jgi:hypothetical protein
MVGQREIDRRAHRASLRLALHCAGVARGLSG